MVVPRPRDPYKKKEKGMGNNVPKKKNIKKKIKKTHLP